MLQRIRYPWHCCVMHLFTPRTRSSAQRHLLMRDSKARRMPSRASGVTALRNINKRERHAAEALWRYGPCGRLSNKKSNAPSLSCFQRDSRSTRSVPQPRFAPRKQIALHSPDFPFHCVTPPWTSIFLSLSHLTIPIKNAVEPNNLKKTDNEQPLAY